jgi:hypothetical protein
MLKINTILAERMHRSGAIYCAINRAATACAVIEIGITPLWR